MSKTSSTLVSVLRIYYLRSLATIERTSSKEKLKVAIYK